MDIKKHVAEIDSQGNAAAQYSDYVARSGSWQYGRDVAWNFVEQEKKEEDNIFGVPSSTKDSTAK